MARTVTGDFRRLGQLAKTLQTGLLYGAARRDLMEALATEARTLIDLEFDQSRDPSNRAWYPVKRAGKPLIDTGTLRSSFTSKAYSRGFVVSTNVPYAKFHQYGTKFIHVRQMIPEGKLSWVWERELKKVVASWLKGEISGSGEI